MRSCLILIAVSVLAGCKHRPTNPAYPVLPVLHRYTLDVGPWEFGFEDWELPDAMPPWPVFHVVHFGPLGSRRVPFTATQGFLGLCLALILLVLFAAVSAGRWRKRKANRI